MDLIVDNARQSGVRPARIVLVDPAFVGDHMGHHGRLNAGYAELFGVERCWFAVGPGRRTGYGVAPDRIIPAFSVSSYEAAEIQRLGRFGHWLQSLAYRDNWPLPRHIRRGLQALLRWRRPATGPNGPTSGPHASAVPYFAAELARLIDTGGVGPGDHLVFTSLDARLGRALLELVAVRGLAALPALHLRLMYNEQTPTRGALDYQALVERLAATGQVGERLSLHCETAAHAERLSALYGVPVGVAPYPAKALPPPTSRDRLTVGFLGEARPERGFRLLEPIVDAFGRRHPDLANRVLWRFHAGGQSIEAARARDIVRAQGARPGPSVQYRFGTVSPETYERMRAEADIVLAPQDRAVYAERGSGVAHEAMAGGRPLVCFAGSSLATQGAAVATAETVDGLADAIAGIVRDPVPWFEQAQIAARAFQRGLADSALVRICDRPPVLLTDRPVALIVGPWSPETSMSGLMARQAQTLFGLGYQVVRVHLINSGTAVGPVLGAVLRGPLRDLDTSASFVVEAVSPGGWQGARVPSALEAMCRNGRVDLIVSNSIQAAGWASGLPAAGKRVVRILEAHDLDISLLIGEAPSGAPRVVAELDVVIFSREEDRAVGSLQGPGQRRFIAPDDPDHAGRWRELLVDLGALPPMASRAMPSRS